MRRNGADSWATPGRRRMCDTRRDPEWGIVMRVLQASQQPIWAVACSASGRWLAAGGGKADVRVWDLSQEGRPQRLPDSREALALAFRPDGLLLLACRGRGPRAFRWPGGEMVGSADAFPVYASYGVGFTPDGQVIHGTHDRIGCWDPVTGAHLWEGTSGGVWG